ncbi:unnamed protein product [Allacma fusca]|uniref:Kinesin motor domain-containing protein n=1 Tax=Allacma fusca TaxID=39272 RepID=A0A8J2JW44_9HEXA|nr:unnamed protein product [Allacma fusca]
MSQRPRTKKENKENVPVPFSNRQVVQNYSTSECDRKEASEATQGKPTAVVKGHEESIQSRYLLCSKPGIAGESSDLRVGFYKFCEFCVGNRLNVRPYCVEIIGDSTNSIMALVKCTSEDTLFTAPKRREEEESIQVFVRVRPLNHQEKTKHSYSILDCPGTREVVVKERNGSQVTKTFTFDRAFGPQSKQLEVYKAVVAPLLEKVIQGYNCTVFAYGQTGTGKTFTMEGERSETAVNWSQDPMAGIVPRALGQLFDELRAQNAEFTIRVSFLELYNEELYDLLAPVEGAKLKNLRMFEDPNKKNSITISGLEEVIVQSKHEVYQIMEKGSERRRTAATLMNASSSRSHTVLTVIVHIKESPMEGEDLLKIGKLNLVDLAGSENIGRSGAVDKRAREAGNINQSLLTLGRVITALVEHAPHIPYRESKLTRILKDSLGGTTKTSIIATVSPAHINTEETLSTLEYAHRAKNIYNQPVVNQRLTKHLVMSHYTEEIERLRKDLAASREKNGVWVDRVNYDESQAKLVSLSQELQNNTTHIKHLSETLEKCQVDISVKDAEITDLQDETQTLKLILEETRSKLMHTEKQLRKAEQAKEEQEHLVEKHVVTEKKLANEATSLMSTADEVTSNIERLYNKLERKRHVEQTNLEAGKRLKKEIADQLNEISENIDNFRKDHATFCGEQRMVLDEFLGEQAKIIDEFQLNSKDVYEHLKSVCVNSANLVEDQNKAILNLQGLNQEEILSKCQNSFKVMNEVIGKIVEVELLEVTDKMTTIQADVTQIVENFKNQMSTQNNNVSKFVDSNLMVLDKYRKELKKIYQLQMNTTANVNNAVKDQHERTSLFADTVQAKAREFIAGMEELMGKSSEYKERTEQQLNMITKEVTTAEEQSKKHISHLTQSFESDKVTVKNFRDAHIEGSEAYVASTSSKNSSVLQACHTGVEKMHNVSAELNAETARQQQQVAELQNLLDQGKTDIDRSIKEFKSQFDSNQQQISSDSDTLVNGYTNTINDAVTRDTEFIGNTKSALQNHCVVVYDWSEVQRSSVYQQAGKVREFWDSTYLIDHSTGATPHKQAYSYPRSLSATSPHERIIGRFRQTRRVYDDDEDRENF